MRYQTQNRTKMLHKKLLTLLVVFAWAAVNAANAQQTGTITGVVKDKTTQESLVGATVLLEGTTIGTATDVDGNFKITNIPVKSYNLRVQYVGYQTYILYNIVVTSGNVLNFSLELEPFVTETKEVEVVNRSFGKKLETPLSVQNLTVEEIKSNPGGNFDVSRVVQALPGVGGSTGTGGGVRNDIIIRGGAPNENVFYLDGIEIPVINHFSTQGSSGGPQGILNVSFLQDVSLSSSSFGARYDNALSSVFSFQQKEGNREKLQGNFRLSGTEISLTGEGPLSKSKNTTFIASVRRSYLQFLFQALDLPIRPNYWDFQYKVSHKINDKTTLNFIGVGAIDEFSFAPTKNSTPTNTYILRSVPINNQWNYTTGLALKRLINKGFINITLSRNELNNRLDRFEDNEVKTENTRILGIKSAEIENKFRADINRYVGKWRYAAGVMAQYVQYTNNGFTRIRNEVKDSAGTVIQPGVNVNFNDGINFFKFGAFGEASRKLLRNRLNVNVGIRADGNTFTTEGENLLNTLSPRVSLSYQVTSKFSINATSGMYYKLPNYTVLGFKDNNGSFANKNSKYIQTTHYVAGLEYLPTAASRITVEGFYKQYVNYPVSVRDGISLANQGADFGIVGNEAINSNGKGRAYGFEVFFQQKLTKDIFATVSYTFVISEFTGANGKYLPSAWDNRHLISGILGKKFKKGWEMGLKYRFAGGAPYTPFDMAASRVNYLSLGTGVLDYSQLNSQRLASFNQFDFRIDKKINFRKATLDLFFDVQNAFVIANPAYPQYAFKRTEDNKDFATTDGNPIKTDGSNAVVEIITENTPTVVPTLGFILEF